MKWIERKKDNKSVIEILGIIFLLLCICRKIIKICVIIINAVKLKDARRSRAYNKVLSDWIYYNYDCEKFEKALSRKRMKRIAIYGVGTLGELFYRTIENSNIEIACFIDKSAEDEEGINGIPLYKLDNYEYEGDIDAIIVTAVFDIDEITEDLLEKEVPKKKIVSLEKIVR